MTETSGASFGGLRVAGFESRRAAEMTRLLKAAGAVAFVSPAMREVPLQHNEVVLRFARGVVAEDFDVVVLMTGVGFRLLRQALTGEVDDGAFLQALSRITTIARGPKPVAALREAGLDATVRIGEPNTWRDILAACREQTPNVAGARIAIQEHGVPNLDLRAGLEQLGARVTSVPVYEWSLPEDTALLEANLCRIVEGGVDVVLFTSSRQVIHVLQVAQRLGIESALRDAFRRLVVCSVGPTTTETLTECGIPVDIGPQHPRLGYLISEAAARAPGLVRAKAELARQPR